MLKDIATSAKFPAGTHRAPCPCRASGFVEKTHVVSLAIVVPVAMISLGSVGAPSPHDVHLADLVALLLHSLASPFRFPATPTTATPQSP